MQGANSKMVYYPKYVIKTVIEDEEYEQPLNVAAAREVYLMQLAKTAYDKIPEFYALTGSSITMERVHGTQLGEYMRLYGNSNIYRSITSKISNALKNILSVGIVHKDLSYENIIIDNQGLPWIVDFGRSRLVRTGEDINMLYQDDMYIYFDTLNDYLQARDISKGHIIPEEYRLP